MSGSEFGSPVASCNKKVSSLLAQVSRPEAKEIAFGITVNLSRAGKTTSIKAEGNPARAKFENIKQGNYSVQVDLEDGAEFQMLSDNLASVDIGKDEQKVLIVKIDYENWDFITASEDSKKEIDEWDAHKEDDWDFITASEDSKKEVDEWDAHKEDDWDLVTASEDSKKEVDEWDAHKEDDWDFVTASQV